MQLPATESPTRDAPDFAGLLAALATPARKREAAWNDEDLADDVATLSYESALRAHARYRPADRVDGALTQIAKEKVALAVQKPPTATEQGRGAGLLSAAGLRASEKERKSSSITIRMSKAECEQLHRRAVEAGLSVSAYLRSCTLEAEALRAQVKEALAEMRGMQVAKEEGGEGAVRQGSRATSEGERNQHSQPDLGANGLARILGPIRGFGNRLLRSKAS